MSDHTSEPAPIWFLTTEKQNGIVESYNYAYLKRMTLDRNGEQNSLTIAHADCEVLIQGYGLDLLLQDIQQGKPLTIIETCDYYTHESILNEAIVTYIERREIT